MSEKKVLTVTTNVNAPIGKVWSYWNGPEHIIHWSSGHPDWHTPRATNDLKTGGSFSSRMEAKDGSMGFDFGGIYDVVEENKYIEYTLGDQRKVKIWFGEENSITNIKQSFEAEEQNSLEMQQNGWQNIMDNFKKYVENN